MGEYKEIEFADCTHMATNPVNPGRGTAKKLLNVEAHTKPGALKLRSGYGEKYLKPSDSRITSDTFLNFDMCFDRQADSAGRELTCLIQKGTVVAIDSSGNPVVADTLNMLCFWVRPYWTGSDWTSSWQWLNETIITKITTGSFSPEQNVIEIHGGTNQSIAADDLVGYTIYNKTKDEIAKIITNKAVDANTSRINHTVFESDWDIDDVLIISKNWIEIVYLEELYNTTWDEIQFHRLLHDLRIGFGGYENRPGLAVGYREKYLMIEEIDFTSVHSDLTAAAIEAFAEIDGIVLDTHILDTSGAYGFDLVEVAGTLPADTYYFRLVGVIDGYEKHLVYEESVTLPAGTKDLEIYPWIHLSKMNPRFTNLELYKSIDGITYYKIKEYVVRSDEFSASVWKIDEYGRLYFGSGELHNEDNAVNIANEINSVGSWVQFPTSGINWLTVESSGAGGSSYSFKFGILGLIKPAVDARIGIRYPVQGLKRFTTYNLDVYLRSEGVGGTTLYAFFVGDSESLIGRPQKIITVANNVFAQHNLEIETGENEETPTSLVIASQNPSVDNRFYVDLVSLKEKEALDFNSSTENGIEMKTALGHTPTYNVVKGWDQVLKFRGHAYYLNPYVDKRYDNFLLVSHINQSGAFMYDIASFSNYRELELFDSNKAIGMALLPTFELLILKDKSIMAIDPDTGAPREPVFGVSCVSLNSIENINGIIYWAGEEEVYILNIAKGFWAQSILKDTIRDLYLPIQNKDKIFGVRDLFNTYRIRLYDAADKIEYLFADKGPVETRKHLFPEIYRTDQYGDLNFLNEGNIYGVDTHLSGALLDDEGNYLIDDEGHTPIL